jgi:hypothetical protein
MFDDDLFHPIGSLAHWKFPPFFSFGVALAARLAGGKWSSLSLRARAT